MTTGLAFPPVCMLVCFCVPSSLELFLLDESATVHIQNLKDLLDVLSCHGFHPHHFKELFRVECFSYRRQER